MFKRSLRAIQLQWIFRPSQILWRRFLASAMAAAGLSLSSALSGLSLCHSLGSSYAVGESRLPQQARPGVGEVKLPGLTIEAAHKKGSGSTKNGRDSNPKFLGVKIYGDQPAQPGAIIVRQRGTKFHPGKNVGLGRDYTIFSKINGLVKFEKLGPDRKQISVYPITEEKVENPDSRKVRKREWFRQIREKKRAKLEAEYGTFEIPIEFGIASAESEESPETTVIC